MNKKSGDAISCEESGVSLSSCSKGGFCIE